MRSVIWSGHHTGLVAPTLKPDVYVLASEAQLATHPVRDRPFACMSEAVQGRLGELDHRGQVIEGHHRLDGCHRLSASGFVGHVRSPIYVSRSHSAVVVAHRPKSDYIHTMDIDGKILAANVNRHIAARRADSAARKGTEWTERDVAKRLTEAGNPLSHPAVIRMRKGQRTVSVGEWLHVALVLSVPPLDLLVPEGGDKLTIGKCAESPERVREWITGDAPLTTVPNPDAYRTAAGGRTPQRESHFSAVLRSLADQYDAAPGERDEIALTTIQTAAGTLKALRRAATRWTDQVPVMAGFDRTED